MKQIGSCKIVSEETFVKRMLHRNISKFFPTLADTAQSCHMKWIYIDVKLTSICWGVAKCVHEIGRNQKIKSPHFRFKWCFLCSGGLNMMILDQIIQKKTKTTTKTTTKQPKTSTHCFWFLWTGQGTFLVEDFHRPNGAKILRFCNFPHTLTYPRGFFCWKIKN